VTVSTASAPEEVQGEVRSWLDEFLSQ